MTVHITLVSLMLPELFSHNCRHLIWSLGEVLIQTHLIFVEAGTYLSTCCLTHNFEKLYRKELHSREFYIIIISHVCKAACQKISSQTCLPFLSKWFSYVE